MQTNQFYAIISSSLPTNFGILSEDPQANDTALFGIISEDFHQKISPMAENRDGKIIVPEGTAFFGMLYGDGTYFDMEAIEAESEWGVIGTLQKDDIGNAVRIFDASGCLLLELTDGIDQIPRVYPVDMFAFEANLQRCA